MHWNHPWIIVHFLPLFRLKSFPMSPFFFGCDCLLSLANSVSISSFLPFSRDWRISLSSSCTSLTLSREWFLKAISSRRFLAMRRSPCPEVCRCCSCSSSVMDLPFSRKDQDNSNGVPLASGWRPSVMRNSRSDTRSKLTCLSLPERDEESLWVMDVVESSGNNILLCSWFFRELCSRRGAIESRRPPNLVPTGMSSSSSLSETFSSDSCIAMVEDSVIRLRVKLWSIQKMDWLRGSWRLFLVTKGKADFQWSLLLWDDRQCEQN